jgi:RND family efflux transporter MFP subunit
LARKNLIALAIIGGDEEPEVVVNSSQGERYSQVHPNQMRSDSTLMLFMPRSSGMNGSCRPLIVGLALTFLLAACSRKPAAPVGAAPTVLVTAVVQKDVPIYDEFVGTLDGSINASIQARVQGYLTSQNYKEGTAVKKDDLLFQIDPRPLAAALEQAKAAKAQAEAAQKQAELTAQRNIDLSQRKAISDQERDNAVQVAAAAKAQTEAQQAAVDQAQLNVDYASIRSPIDGIAGLATAQVGDLVGPTTGALTTVAKVDPIKAYFTVSDQRYVVYAERYSDPAKRAAHEKELEFELILADGSRFAQKGELFAAQNQIDVRTGTVRIAAIFPNPGNILRPGQFARIRVRTDLQKGALLVPQRAVIELQGNYLVAVVDSNNKAHLRPVKPGRRIDSMWIVQEGLRAGDHIVVEGVQKVREGSSVAPQPWTPPAEASATPSP